jgi:hypothetical protein
MNKTNKQTGSEQRVKYAMDYRSKNSFSMSCASRMVIFPGAAEVKLLYYSYREKSIDASILLSLEGYS